MQGHPTVLANTTIPVSHITKTPVPTVRSQPTADGSVSGSVQVATTSGVHKHQKVNLISYFALAVTFRILNSLFGVWKTGQTQFLVFYMLPISSVTRATKLLDCACFTGCCSSVYLIEADSNFARKISVFQPIIGEAFCQW